MTDIFLQLLKPKSLSHREANAQSLFISNIWSYKSSERSHARGYHIDHQLDYIVVKNCPSTYGIDMYLCIGLMGRIFPLFHHVIALFMTCTKLSSKSLQYFWINNWMSLLLFYQPDTNLRLQINNINSFAWRKNTKANKGKICAAIRGIPFAYLEHLVDICDAELGSRRANHPNPCIIGCKRSIKWSVIHLLIVFFRGNR